jgi:tRNA nucleotidyltransferase/poly(A) polymerase
MLLGRETHDIDVSVEESAANLARVFADENDAAFYLMDPNFDVARVIFAREGVRDIVDFARLRGENIKADLSTRDFTINAMAVNVADLSRVEEE